MDRELADKLWCKHCDCFHPRTNEYYYFNANGTVLGCIKKRRANSLQWNAANHERKRMNDVRHERRKRIKKLKRIYPGVHPRK